MNKNFTVDELFLSFQNLHCDCTFTIFVKSETGSRPILQNVLYPALGYYTFCYVDFFTVSANDVDDDGNFNHIEITLM